MRPKLMGVVKAWVSGLGVRSTQPFPRAASRLLDGQRGENIAARYLAGQGYKIVERNFRCPLGEIDLVAKEGNTLCFIEVKARRSIRFGWPEESVTPFKQRRLRRLAQWYLKARRITGVPVRFDVVSLLLDEAASPARTRLIKGAF